MEFVPSSSSSTSTKVLQESTCQRQLLLLKHQNKLSLSLMAASFLQNRNGCLSWSFLWSFLFDLPQPKNEIANSYGRNSARVKTSKWVEALLYGCVLFFRINMSRSHGDSSVVCLLLPKSIEKEGYETVPPALLDIKSTTQAPHGCLSSLQNFTFSSSWGCRRFPSLPTLQKKQ